MKCKRSERVQLEAIFWN